jgi:hypothetical protein
MLIKIKGVLMKSKFEDLEIFILAERLADDIWDTVIRWDAFAKKTIGSQLVNAADGIGSNIAEGSGKGSYLDCRRYIKIAVALFMKQNIGCVEHMQGN